MNSWRRYLLYGVGALVLLGGLWLWWQRPQPVDMATYAPADTLVYLEANSLPDILTGLTATAAWQKLAPPAGLRTDLGRFGWLSRLAAWTGIGPAETVVLARAQLAVVVADFATAEEPEQALHIRPRAALVVETHTSAGRTRAAAEQLVGSYARRVYGTQPVVTQEAGNATLTVWAHPRGELPLVLAVMDSLLIIGNDEPTVQACLAVRRGERPALALDPQLPEMRARLADEAELAFGYIPQTSTQRLLAVAAVAYAGRFSDDQRAQSAAAILLPQLATRIIGGVAWSTHVEAGAITDTYLLALQNQLPARLHDALAPASAQTFDTGTLLPDGAYQLTRYDYRDPAAAWRGLHAALSSQLDITIAPFVGRFLDEALKPFGVAEPREFLRAAGPEIATVRLDETGSGLVLVARVRDREALRAQVRQQLGNARTERVGGAELLISSDAERGAASFVADYLLLGAAEDLRRCLAAHAAARTLAGNESFATAARTVSTTDPAAVTTLTDERAPARDFMMVMVRQRGLRTGPPDEAGFGRALAALPYAVSETRLVEGGFEKQTRSAFGQFATIASQFAAGAAP